MWNIFLFFGLCFFLFFLVGPLIEKIRVPWIFSALLVGTLLAFYNPFPITPSEPSFKILSDLGMYFLLFIIGLEIDLDEIKKLGGLIIRTTFSTIALATLFGSLFIHYVFGTPWMAAILVAMSFGTVGEAILVPILDEFKIIHTKLGQTIIGVATLDDVFELASLLWLSILLGIKGDIHKGMGLELLSFVSLILITVLFYFIKKYIPKIKIPNYNGIVLGFMLIIFFGYVGLGRLAGMEALAAILAGVITKYFVSDEQFSLLETHTKLLTYGFLAPIFFLGVGMEMNMNYLVANFWIVVLITLISKSAKLLGSWYTGRKILGTKTSILMGIALSVRFSTSIVIISILYQHQLIGSDLFTILIASSILFKFIVPPLFAYLLVRWKVAFNPE